MVHSSHIVKRKPRILYIFNVAWFFLSHRLPFALEARRLGYEVHVAAVALPGEAERIEAHGMIFHSLPFTRRGMNPLKECLAWWSLFRLYAKLKPDLVEHATIKPVIYGSLSAALFPRTRVVNWMTGLGYVFIAKTVFLKHMVARLYRAAFGKQALKLIFENPDDWAQFVNGGIVAAEKSVVIRGAGVDTNLFSPSREPPGKVLVVLAARMLWDKGVGEFVEAATILRGQGQVSARLALVGDSDEGNPTSIPNEQLKEWKRSGDVEWWGRRCDMAAVLAKAHIVCLPSYREGLPKVLLEAAAFGRPIVATDVPGCREVVKDGINGLLVPARDGRALAAALGTLIRDRKTREKMGRKGREIALNEFSEEKVVAETMMVYQELLSP